MNEATLHQSPLYMHTDFCQKYKPVYALTAFFGILIS